MRLKLGVWILGVWVFTALLGAGYWFIWGPGADRAGEAPEGLVKPLDRQQVALGQGVYQTYCAQCHGLRAEGQPNWQQRNPDGSFPPPPHDATGHTWHHSDGLLYRIVRDGGQIYEDPGFKSGMPAFGDRLHPEEIRAVITYLKSLWGPEERKFQAQVSLEDPFP
jgi:mono/diheme cytochrome c family protein